VCFILIFFGCLDDADSQISGQKEPGDKKSLDARVLRERERLAEETRERKRREDSARARENERLYGKLARARPTDQTRGWSRGSVLSGFFLILVFDFGFWLFFCPTSHLVDLYFEF
jgi:hypothetical protein